MMANDKVKSIFLDREICKEKTDEEKYCMDNYIGDDAVFWL